ncbi:MAG: NTP transferase domain-containing protein [Pseudomonadota bacterium]|nr:NTP transferase domain-containing protein [Pseudomonadota bacterium]
MHVALVMAKKGSKGLPGKNLMSFRGKPLLEHTLDDFRKAGCFDRIVLSTNCPDLARQAKKCGVEVIMRGNELAENARFVDAVNHAIERLDPAPSTVTIAQIVQPLRRPGLFRDIIATHGPGVDSVVTVKRFESAVDWIYVADETVGRLKHVQNVTYGETIGRRNDLVEIDNAVVSFTYDSWKRGESLTSWGYLGFNIAFVENAYLNKNYTCDINVSDDFEWLEFIAAFPEWKRLRNAKQT